MTVSARRFELALKQLKPTEWERFEDLSSIFLAADFPGLRTMASPGGDRGRDAELYSVTGEPTVLLQYSVREDWDQKIKGTLKRLSGEFPGIHTIVFMSSQKIGAKADSIKTQARSQGVSLDIRDQSWFIERLDTDDSRRNAAAELARVIVDPLLEREGVITRTRGLTGQEARTALVFLEMQTRDENTKKGLTKSCFESLVKASLQGTTVSNRIPRSEIHKKIQTLLPRHDANRIASITDSTLSRLQKSSIKYHKKTDDFHISFEDNQKIQDTAAELMLLRQSFETDIYDIVHVNLKEDVEKISKTQKLIRQILETYFLKLGEEFAQSVASDREIPLHADMLKDVVQELSPKGGVSKNQPWSDFLYSSVKSLISNPSDETTELFRVLSTAYTLFAFLEEVPDVQKATRKLFEHGNLWFDTTVLLPLFAERAFPEDMRPFTDLMQQLRRTGLKLRVTSGIIEEVEGHLKLCKTYMLSQNWVGRVPYVYQRYVISGGEPSGFRNWAEQFMGDHRPIEDLADFLQEAANIEVSDLPSWENIPESVVVDIREYWQRIQQRRDRGPDGVNLNAFRMAEHDAETYLSVLAERRVEPGKSTTGYTSWLVTLDSAAWKLLQNVNRETSDFVRHGVVVSLDFLVRYLYLGPRRDQIDTSRNAYSRIFASTIYESVPTELIKVAQEVRQSCRGLSERLVQRRIRDALDTQRMKAGEIQSAGLEAIDTAISDIF